MVSAMVLPYTVVGLWLVVVIGVVLGVHLLLPHRRSVVVCPNSRLPAAVDIDGQSAIEACSRWSNVQDCKLNCLPQLWFAAEELEDFLAKQESQIVRLGSNPRRLVCQPAGPGQQGHRR